MAFPLAVVSRAALTLRGPYGKTTPWLIVGVGYPGVARFSGAARSEDYTPPLIEGATTDSRGRPIGGADHFLDVMQQALKPAITERFPVDSSRQALLGHSYGGLFALYTLLTQPDAFSDYMAISPSLWWQDGALFERVARHPLAASTPRLLIGVGTREAKSRPPPLASTQAPRDGERPTPAARGGADRFAAALQRRQPAWEIDYRAFPDVGHGDAMWPAMQAVWKFLEDPDRGGSLAGRFEQGAQDGPAASALNAPRGE